MNGRYISQISKWKDNILITHGMFEFNVEFCSFITFEIEV